MKTPITAHKTRVQLIDELQQRADYCSDICDDPGWDERKTEHDGESLDYWQGALTSACLALHLAEREELKKRYNEALKANAEALEQEAQLAASPDISDVDKWTDALCEAHYQAGLMDGLCAANRIHGGTELT